MNLTEIERHEIYLAIASSLVYFEWLDQGQNADRVPGYNDLNAMERIAYERYQTDAIFHAKVRSLANSIEFVLMDASTVQRRREQSRLTAERLYMQNNPT